MLKLITVCNPKTSPCSNFVVMWTAQF